MENYTFTVTCLKVPVQLLKTFCIYSSQKAIHLYLKGIGTFIFPSCIKLNLSFSPPLQSCCSLTVPLVTNLFCVLTFFVCITSCWPAIISCSVLYETSILVMISRSMLLLCLLFCLSSCQCCIFLCWTVVPGVTRVILYIKVLHC